MNKYKGTELKLDDGRSVEIRFTLNELVEIQDLLGLDDLSKFDEKMGALDFKKVRKLLQLGAGLENEEDAGKLPCSFSAMMDAVTAALTICLAGPPSSKAKKK